MHRLSFAQRRLAWIFRDHTRRSVWMAPSGSLDLFAVFHVNYHRRREPRRICSQRFPLSGQKRRLRHIERQTVMSLARSETRKTAFVVMSIKLISLDGHAIRFEDPANVVGLRQELAGDVDGRIARSRRT